MKKVLYAIVSLVAVAAVLATIVYNTTAGQGAILDRALKAQFSRPSVAVEGSSVESEAHAASPRARRAGTTTARRVIE